MHIKVLHQERLLPLAYKMAISHNETLPTISENITKL